MSLTIACRSAAPIFFFIDIQPAQVRGVSTLRRRPGRAAPWRGAAQPARAASPRINGVPVEQRRHRAPMRAGRCSASAASPTAATPAAGSRVVAGAWWPADYRGPPLVSLDADLARGLRPEAGRQHHASMCSAARSPRRIANLREIDWSLARSTSPSCCRPVRSTARPRATSPRSRAARAPRLAVERAATEALSQRLGDRA